MKNLTIYGDKSFMFGYKILRLILMALSCMVVASKPDSAESFFKSLAVFGSGLGCDYFLVILTSRGLEKSKKKVVQTLTGWAGLFLSLVYCVFGLGGIFSSISLSNIGKNSMYIINTEKFVTFTIKISYPMFTWWIFATVLVVLVELFNEIVRFYEVDNKSSNVIRTY